MAHLQQQILEALAVSLSDETAAGANVFLDRPEEHTLADDEVPCLLIEDGDEDVVNVTVSFPRRQNRTFKPTVRAIAGTKSAARGLQLEVEELLSANRMLGGLVKDLRVVGSEKGEIDGAGGKQYATKDIHLEIDYSCVETTPDTAT